MFATVTPNSSGTLPDLTKLTVGSTIDLGAAGQYVYNGPGNFSPVTSSAQPATGATASASQPAAPSSGTPQPAATTPYVARNPALGGAALPQASDVAASEAATMAQDTYDTQNPSSDPAVSKLESDLSSTINSINAQFDSEVTGQQSTNAQNEGSTNAESAKAGLTGSNLGESALATTKSNDQAAIDAINAQRETMIASVTSQVDASVISAEQARANAANTDESNYLQTMSTVISQAQSSVATIAASGMTFSQFQSASNGATYQKLQSLLGYDDNQMAAMFIANTPKAQIVGSTAVGTQSVFFVQDPKTGAITAQTIETGVPLTSQAKPVFAPDGTMFLQDPTTGLWNVAPATNQGQFAKSVSLTPGNILVKPGGGAAAPAANAESGAPAAPAAGAGSGVDPGTAAWNSLPGTTQESLTAIGYSPTTIGNLGWSWILGGGSLSSTGGSSMGGGAKLVISAAAQSAGQAIMAQYDLTMEDVNAIGAQNSGLESSLSQQIGYQAQVAQFEDTAKQNAQLVLTKATAVGVTGSPIANEYLQYVQGTIAGNADITAFQTAITTFADEYAKVVSGSTGSAGSTDAARTQAVSLINSAMSKGQLSATIATMQTEMANRMTALNSNISSLTAHLANVVQNYQTTNGSNSSSAAAPSQQTVNTLDVSTMTSGTTVQDQSNPGVTFTYNGDGTFTGSDGNDYTFDTTQNAFVSQ